ncbi:RRM domain-containing protein [Citrus sinensis]|nr:hypothetical protein CICLE_v10008764mg [Citrus x clementina]KAH9761995.1 RRM domain-containing protein [Citrus sinensis]KAH9800390.1 RRM domain-containing protein [Citrus sinensis]
MTIDDESSVYVGGLPYSANEDSVRKVFDKYGSVVAVKIVNDRSTRGKCYGFVTFGNPRSAVDAINDMNGRTIDGRVVRVSEVATRGRKSNSGRDQFRHGHRHKGRDRDNNRHRDRYQDRYNDRSRERTSSQDRDKGMGREYEHVRDHDRDPSRDRFSDEDQGRDLENNDQGHTRIHDPELANWERKSELDMTRDREIDGTDDYHTIVDEGKDHLSRKRDGSTVDDHQLREFSSNSSDDNSDQVKELDRSIQRREELKKEISHMEERVNVKEQLVLDLQKRSKKLEEALINAKKLSSHRQKQLTKLYKCFIQVNEYAERLKSCEREFQVSIFNQLSFFLHYHVIISVSVPCCKI